MRVVLRLAAHGLRTRWPGWLLLVLLIAVAGGAVLTAAAGARRTASAYPRYLRASHASDLLVAAAGTGLALAANSSIYATRTCASPCWAASIPRM